MADEYRVGNKNSKEGSKGAPHPLSSPLLKENTISEEEEGKNQDGNSNPDVYIFTASCFLGTETAKASFFKPVPKNQGPLYPYHCK
ncbi:hypothetical protein Y1Q_0018023 [Alligator mississippiensis]|uniref:Uncharacterized protein n=1 Tax=Alligator mississippiensis TaxID=8496 RepID=A0A151MXW2_ALLMI|nr:hypothetical protein Y1Q_0018023 [Alligator mississippiensis]